MDFEDAISEIGDYLRGVICDPLQESMLPFSVVLGIVLMLFLYLLMKRMPSDKQLEYVVPFSIFCLSIGPAICFIYYFVTLTVAVCRDFILPLLIG